MVQDIYSIMLRERVNNTPLSQRSKERLEGFEIEKESDAATMAQVGVWADHTQIERLSEYLRTNIWLVHLRTVSFPPRKDKLTLAHLHL